MINYIIDKTRVEVFFSPDDEGYIARLKDNHNISAFGKSEEDVIEEISIVLEMIKECKDLP